MRISHKIAYSQNFIKSAELVDRLIKISNIKNTDTVIEIGPGKGIITKQLAQIVTTLIAVEIDNQLSNQLRSELYQFDSKPNIYNCDFLEYPLPISDYKVFSNIPFNFTSRIMKKLFMSDENSPTHSYIVLQKEVYEKYKGEKRETQMSLLFKPKYEVNKLHKFNRNDFEPKANVDTVFVEIKKRKNILIPLEKYNSYKDFTVYATSQWEPNIKKALKKIFTYEQLKRLSKNIRFDMNEKCLDLKFDQWIQLFDYYHQYVIVSKKNIVKGSFEKHIKQIKNNEKKDFNTA